MKHFYKILPLIALAVLAFVTISPSALAAPHVESYIEVAAMAQEFAATHQYITGVYDCDDMSITLANEYRFRGYNATLMIGNPLRNVTSLSDINHAWVMVEVNGQRFAVESTNGRVDLTSPLYYTGWPVGVDDYWAFLEVHLYNFQPVPMQSYPVPGGIP